MSKYIYSVTALVGEIRASLEDTYHDIWVAGEISNLATPASGHMYFSLKEGTSLVRCALFSRQRKQFTSVPAEGMQVLVRGRISVYEARGDMQLIVSYLEDAGEGALRREFELLKRKLSEEGLFDKQHKQPLPSYPKVIGIISSSSGAVLHDIRVTLQRRYPVARLVVYPTLVQGEGATDNIINMLTVANERKEADLLILARGGGSAEDLQAFNQEDVARAVFASTLPIVSAIGHETDYSITDWVADERAPTPTAAAESVSPDRVQLCEAFQSKTTTLHRVISRILDTLRQHLDTAQLKLIHPQQQIHSANQSRLALTNKLKYLTHAFFNKRQLQIQQQIAELRYRSPQARLTQNLQTLRTTRKQLQSGAMNRFTTANQTIRHLTHKLKLMSPAHTLDRGYAILQTQNNDVVVDATETRKGEVLTASVARGKFQCVVDNVVEE